MTDPPPGRDLVVLAASAGGVEALKRIVAELPADLPATVLVALHVPPLSRSYLDQVLTRRSALPVVSARHGQPLLPGQVVVAQPDAHLLVVDGRIALGRGPRENGARPAHDAMLRSAALDRGTRVVAAVLTGMLDDGAAGLATVRRYGGCCLVQDPAEADFPSMPAAARQAVPDALVRPLPALVEEVVRIVRTPPGDRPVEDARQRARDQAELESALGRAPRDDAGLHPALPSAYACPDCHGVLGEVPDEDVIRFRCRTGHAWSAASLVNQLDTGVEEALWMALRALEERTQLSQRLADTARDDHRHWAHSLFSRRAEEAGAAAALLRSLVRSRDAEDDGGTPEPEPA